MIRDNFLFVVLVFASLALFVSAGTSFAGGTPTLPDSGGTGVVRGKVSLPDEVFVSANTGSPSFGGQAAQAKCRQSDPGDAPEITDMIVNFWTRTSGVVQVLYCGVLDSPENVQVDVRALVDSFPHTGNDIVCQPSQIQWERAESDDNGGSSCFSWICEVENPKNCGIFHKDWCWTQHNVHMECFVNPTNFFAQFNFRIMKVFYNKFHEQSADPPPPPPL